jgi:hypothetical protein
VKAPVRWYGQPQLLGPPGLLARPGLLVLLGLLAQLGLLARDRMRTREPGPGRRRRLQSRRVGGHPGWWVHRSRGWQLPGRMPWRRHVRAPGRRARRFPVRSQQGRSNSGRLPPGRSNLGRLPPGRSNPAQGHSAQVHPAQVHPAQGTAGLRWRDRQGAVAGRWPAGTPVRPPRLTPRRVGYLPRRGICPRCFRNREPTRQVSARQHGTTDQPTCLEQAGAAPAPEQQFLQGPGQSTVRTRQTRLPSVPVSSVPVSRAPLSPVQAMVQGCSATGATAPSPWEALLPAEVRPRRVEGPSRHPDRNSRGLAAEVHGPAHVPQGIGGQGPVKPPAPWPPAVRRVAGAPRTVRGRMLQQHRRRRQARQGQRVR